MTERLRVDVAPTRTAPDTPQPGIQPALYPSGVMDAQSIQDHIVQRQDLVQLDGDGNVSEKATVIVNGKIFEDWTAVWIQWEWSQPYSQFRFTCAEREPYPDPGQVLQFAPGAAVDIFLGGIQVIKGIILTRQIAYSAEQHVVQLSGISASWAANRSSIEHKTSDFNGKTFTQIADEVLKPTGVNYRVVGTIDNTPFKAGATPTTGETIGQFFERLARDRKIIISNTPDGNFLFIGEHSWEPVGELVEGVNIKKCQCVITDENARSQYIMRGSRQATDETYGRQAAEQEAKINGSLPQYSVLISAMEHPVWTPGEMITRAKTEKMWSEDVNRIQCDITVYGWFRPLPTQMESLAVIKLGPTTGHTLWQAGDEVIVHSPMAMLFKQPLKIRMVTWTQDNNNGTQTLLSLCLSNGLNGRPQALPKKSDEAKADTEPPKTPPPAAEPWPTPPPPKPAVTPPVDQFNTGMPLP